MTDAIRRKEAEPTNQHTKESIVKYELPPLDFEQDENETQSKDLNTGRQWKLPLADYHIIGDLVLLRKEKDVRARAGEAPGKVLRALSISPQEFEKFLYCGIQTHSRTYYDDRVELMLQGKFNYKERWEDCASVSYYLYSLSYYKCLPPSQLNRLVILHIVLDLLRNRIKVDRRAQIALLQLRLQCLALPAQADIILVLEPGLVEPRCFLEAVFQGCLPQAIVMIDAPSRHFRAERLVRFRGALVCMPNDVNVKSRD